MSDAMNDPEAVRCLSKSEEAFQKQDFETAERLARKAYRMFSDGNTAGRSAADTLINKAEKSKRQPTAAPEQSGLHQRRPPPAQSGTASQADSATPEFNPEQEAKCRSILRSKDYYKILGVDKTCSSEEVKKSYRKLALQFHPDKAKCPSAEAAFKELSKAYQCLSDSEARKHYDIYGSEVDAPQQQQQYRQNYESHFMSPEELFESFFGIHFARGPYSQHRVYRAQNSSQHNNNGASAEQRRSLGLLQFFPLLVLLLITVLSSLFNSSNSPPFSFSRTPEYSISRSTVEHQLPYFVQPTFSRTYGDRSDRIKDLEIQIEMSQFSSECSREQQRLLQQLSALKFYGTADQYRKKSDELRQKEESSVNCKNFKKLKMKYPRHAQQFYRQSNSVWF